MARALAAACGLLSCAAGAALDEVALVQRSAAARTEAALDVRAAAGAGTRLHQTADGPVVDTRLGPVLGLELPDHLSFRGIPYVEPPVRFELARSKHPWAPKTLDAKVFKPGCVGAATTEVESEDCLHLNVWVPKGNLSGMPVIVYFHGGLNMHGAGSESLRQGDAITLSQEYPTVFVNLDYRLGIFGWIAGEKGETGVTNNLGLHDQQAALRWVHENIEAFGGDPSQVTLMGQSEGAGNIMSHLVSPGSAGLFGRAVFHSPPADIFLGDLSNRARTRSVVEKVGCVRANMERTLRCLRKIPADTLWRADWSPEDMSRNMFSPTWIKATVNMASFMLNNDIHKAVNYLGYHAVVDGDIVPEDIHTLIESGRWNKVPVLITVSRNESLGVIPGPDIPLQPDVLKMALATLAAKKSDIPSLIEDYNRSLQETGIFEPSSYSLLHQMITDKIWTCEAWNLVEEITKGGGSAQLGGFWHAPKFDPVGSSTNLACNNGATCHAAEMLYSLPQGGGRGIPAFMVQERQFMEQYRDNVLAFVHGHQGPWEVYRPDHPVITLVDETGTKVEENYRKRQCAVLERSVPATFPWFMKRHVPAGLE